MISNFLVFFNFDISYEIICNVIFDEKINFMIF